MESSEAKIAAFSRDKFIATLNRMSRVAMARKMGFALVVVFLSLGLFQPQALAQQKKPQGYSAAETQSVPKQDVRSGNKQLIDKRFARIEKDFKGGKVKFIGKRPTFNIAPNAILQFPLKAVTGLVASKNIKQIAGEQSRIASAVLAVEEEFKNEAILKGKYKEPSELAKCSVDLERFDWRAFGKVSPVKDQGPCGSCVAFATISTLESSHAIRNNIRVDGSEQHTLSCYRGISCRGSNVNRVSQYLVREGTSLEHSYPYTAREDACNERTPTPIDAVAWSYANEWPLIFNSPRHHSRFVAGIKAALCQHGPVTASMWVTPAFSAYSNGIFNENNGVFATNGALRHSFTNHAMALVGWGLDKSSRPWRPYWIVKNSWGTDWGEDGYVRVDMRSNNIGNYSAWINAPLDLLQDPPIKWRRELHEIRNIPSRNKFIQPREGI
ncbi:MAG: C1 family peptidase [Pseudomonadota bacterium]|nr:C1 family peptidase [Pseudomonadota bacterium]